MTTIQKGVERVKVSLAATLETYLPAALDDISAAWNDGVPLPYPALVHPGLLDTIREYPTILVVSTEGDETDDGAPIWAQQEHHFDVVLFAASDSQATLDTQIDRYLLGIWEVVKQHQSLDGNVAGLGGVMTKRYGKSPSFPKSKGLLERQAAWEVVVHTLESV